MSLTKLTGAHYESEQKQVYAATTAVTIPDDCDQLNVTVGSLTHTLPANPKPGQKVTVCGVGVATTVQANTGQSVSNGAVSSGTSRDFVACQDVSGTFVWVPAALA